MIGLRDAVRNVATVSLVVGCLSMTAPFAALAGDLEPMGPPAPTMRTLTSLGFDCPDDPPNTTNLLFTYVVNANGFDTGIAISNTGVDPFGTSDGASDKCTLNFYQGVVNPPAVDSGTITKGTTYTTLASVVAPGFNGYMIATCNFPYAHGFAFISDIGARSVAMGYIPQIICENRKPNSMGGGR